MEPYEKLKKLPDADKAKYFECILESIKLADDSDDPKKKTETTLNLDAILNIANERNVSAEGSCRKKQKTLDSWLIKPKESPKKDKTGECSRTSKESTDQRLSSNVLGCLNSAQSAPNNLNVSSSKDNESSSKNTKQSNKLCNSPVKNVYISGIVTENYKLRSKRKITDSLQLSKSKSRTKSSTFTDNIGINKSNRELIQSDITNNCDNNHDASPGDIVSNHNSNLTDKNDCQKVNLNSSLSKATKSRRSRKNNLNLQDLVQPCTKLNDASVSKDLDSSEKTVSSENDDATDSSSLSNWEAFHILEAECARINLNIVDILQDENVKAVLNDPKKLDNEAVLFIKAFKSNDGKTLPVVHLVDSIKRLCETLKKFQKPL